MDLIDFFDLPSPVVPSKRVCLRCNKEFSSTWAGNRICGSCSKTKVRLAAHEDTRAKGDIIIRKRLEDV